MLQSVSWAEQGLAVQQPVGVHVSDWVEPEGVFVWD